MVGGVLLCVVVCVFVGVVPSSVPLDFPLLLCSQLVGVGEGWIVVGASVIAARWWVRVVLCQGGLVFSVAVGLWIWG